VDFSIASLRALDQAIAIATAARGQLTVVQALAEFRPGLLDARGGGASVDDHRDWIARARRDLEALLPPASRSGCRVEATAWSGTPGDVILGAAAERHADLIVIGASERIGAGRVATGAAVVEVLRRATVPVLIVPWLPGVPRPHGALPARAPVAGLSHVSRT
jgi:nucleotide-binding universal stress UspA family protein